MRSFRRFLFCAVLVLLPLLFAGACAQAQVAASSKDDEVEELRQTVRDLALRVAVLEKQLNQRQTVVDCAGCGWGGGADGFFEFVECGGGGGGCYADAGCGDEVLLRLRRRLW